MSASVRERPVSKRQDVTVKVNSEVVRIAKIVAAYRGISVANYLSETLEPIVQKDLHKEQMKGIPPKLGKAKAAQRGGN